MLSSPLSQAQLPPTHASAVNYSHPSATAPISSTSRRRNSYNNKNNNNNNMDMTGSVTPALNNSDILNDNSNGNSIKNTPNSLPLLSISTKKLDRHSINLGSRRSKLAIVQTELVRDVILGKFPDFQTKITAVSTLGDQVQNKPLYSFGGKSLWTKELELLLYESVGEFEKIDMIIHSLKDMPTNLPEGFELGCILKREDPRDVLILKPNSPYKSLAELPPGSIIGTSSVRRSAQLLKNFPHLQFQSIRGNIQTRIAKLDNPESEYLGILLAAAGLLRTGLGYRISQYLNEDVMYHSVGQGALGVEIRANDEFVKSICAQIRDDNTMFCCLAERSMLRFLEGGCSVPIGCVTDYNDVTKQLTMNAIVVSVDGSEFVEVSHILTVKVDLDAELFGRVIGEKFLDSGAKLILDAIDYDRINEIKQEGISSSMVSLASSLVNTP